MLITVSMLCAWFMCKLYCEVQSEVYIQGFCLFYNEASYSILELIV